MRLSLVFLTTVALVLLTSSPVSSAESTLVASSERLSTGPDSSVKHALQKRAGDDHDHDHDHPTPTSTAATGTATAAPITSPEAPGHDHDHDDHESEHSESESGHSHGPAR